MFDSSSHNPPSLAGNGGVHGLFDRAMSHHVNVEGGIGKEVTYISRRGRRKFFTNAIITEPKMESDASHKDHIEDTVYFNRLTLPAYEKPNTRDVIEYKGKVWLVDSFKDCDSQDGLNAWDIRCVANTTRKNNLSEVS